MFGKINKSGKILSAALLGAILFASAPLSADAFSPNVKTGNGTSLTHNSAILNASVNTNNLSTTVWFEYDTNSNLSSPTPVNASRKSSGGSAWTAAVSGLSTGTAYYFRAVAQNADGISYGNINSFNTASAPYVNYNLNYGGSNSALPVSATTEPASQISKESAQLNSLIKNGGNDSTNAWFEWGTTADLGNETKPIKVGSFQSVRHANTMSGLQPGTKYYFRAVAENSSWKNTGATLSFTTPGTQVTASINTKTDVTNTSAVVESGDESLKAESQPASAAAALMPGTIFGWATLIVFLLILILLSQHLYRQFSNQAPAPAVDTHPHTH